MKTAEIGSVSLANYGRGARPAPLVLTRRGKPVAAVVPIRPGVDLESYGLSHNAEFIELVNRSWADYKANGGVTLESLRERETEAPRTRARRSRAR